MVVADGQVASCTVDEDGLVRALGTCLCTLLVERGGDLGGGKRLGHGGGHGGELGTNLVECGAESGWVHASILCRPAGKGVPVQVHHPGAVRVVPSPGNATTSWRHNP